MRDGGKASLLMMRGLYQSNLPEVYYRKEEHEPGMPLSRLFRLSHSNNPPHMMMVEVIEINSLPLGDYATDFTH